MKRGEEHRFPRSARVNEVLHEVLADELERMSDPRLELVTVTGVQVTPDLKHARVFYVRAQEILSETEVTSPEGDERQEEDGEAAKAPIDAQATAKALESARRHLQAALGRQVRLKYVPRLLFQEDPAVKTGRRIDDIIRELHESGQQADEAGSTTNE